MLKHAYSLGADLAYKLAQEGLLPGASSIAAAIGLLSEGVEGDDGDDDRTTPEVEEDKDPSETSASWGAPIDVTNSGAL